MLTGHGVRRSIDSFAVRHSLTVLAVTRCAVIMRRFAEALPGRDRRLFRLSAPICAGRHLSKGADISPTLSTQ
jgi:hypothetical protein